MRLAFREETEEVTNLSAKLFRGEKLRGFYADRTSVAAVAKDQRGIGSRKMPALDQWLCALDRSANPSANCLVSRAALAASAGFRHERATLWSIG